MPENGDEPDDRSRVAEQSVSLLVERVETLLEGIQAQLPDLRNARAEAIAQHQSRSPEDRLVASKGHLIHKLKAKDTTGRWAYYFVLVEAVREQDFLRAINGDGTIDLEDYGKVVASSYGETPTQEVKDFLKEKYGFTVGDV